MTEIDTAVQDRERRQALQRLPRAELTAYQLQRLNAMVAAVAPLNPFLANKLGGRVHLETVDEFARIPFTYKDELSMSATSGGIVANLTYPHDRYLRFHRTSGTRGRPLIVLDTADDWRWWVATWQYVLDAADVRAGDRCFLAFSFGPFIGFWSAFDALIARGAMAIPAGGMKTVARLEMLRSAQANVLLCTPSYALHLAEVASDNQISTAALGVRSIIVAGEPGGSIPSVRRRLEEAWQAEIIDHGGASEVGPWGVADPAGRGLRVIESEFIAEFLSLDNGQQAQPGELSELVLTPLGRWGAPLLRYRTGDLVRPEWPHDETCRWVLLAGGVLGRVDDMLIIRGVNVFPSAIEQILRGFPEIVEYRLTARKQHALDELEIEIEDRLHDPNRVARELHVRLGLRVAVHEVTLGTLPRFEGKGKRFVDLREK